MTTISTKLDEGALVITSNDGHLDSASAVLEVSATNPDYNQPVLRIKQAGTSGGAASIRIDDPNPDIEFVETGLTGPDPGAGKFEIAVQADRLQINGKRFNDHTGRPDRLDEWLRSSREARSVLVGPGPRQ